VGTEVGNPAQENEGDWISIIDLEGRLMGVYPTPKKPLTTGFAFRDDDLSGELAGEVLSRIPSRARGRPGAGSQCRRAITAVQTKGERTRHAMLPDTILRRPSAINLWHVRSPE
jgi:hypothetical protein